MAEAAEHQGEYRGANEDQKYHRCNARGALHDLAQHRQPALSAHGGQQDGTDGTDRGRLGRGCNSALVRKYGIPRDNEKTREFG